MIPPQGNADFAAAMEKVLDVYRRPYDATFPVVCMDETPRQLVSEMRKRDTRTGSRGTGSPSARRLRLPNRPAGDPQPPSGETLNHWSPREISFHRLSFTPGAGGDTALNRPPNRGRPTFLQT